MISYFVVKPVRLTLVYKRLLTYLPTYLLTYLLTSYDTAD